MVRPGGGRGDQGAVSWIGRVRGVGPGPSTFADRNDAGQRLVELLRGYGGDPEVLVLGLPRGGIPVAYQVATGLGVAMDVYVVRKLGMPGHRELALGAVAAGGVRVLNPDVVAAARLSVREMDEMTARETRLVEERQHAYRGNRAPLRLEGKTLIIVDDGLATGATMRAVVAAVGQQRPARVVVAVPVASVVARDELAGQADEVVCVAVPDPLLAVEAWYGDFAQTTDEEVRRLLAAAPGPPGHDVETPLPVEALAGAEGPAPAGVPARSEPEAGRKGLMASIPPERPTISADEVPEADALEQSQEVVPDDSPGRLTMGGDVPEADALEQAMSVLADEDDDRR